ncbi:hypothetical protein A3Q56_03121 [Intoshia linei]|uniref:CAP-Gly domain-containing protein n=1 Tax=Intoshia linei TaxID=1819745 RepID=A0A177B4I8_9BILA|nr:hypothetical protein A3Q56_03121 [Intoshia linei]
MEFHVCIKQSNSIPKVKIERVLDSHLIVGKWIGIELHEALGKNNGSVNNIRYFNCSPNHGIFCRKSQIQLFKKEPETPIADKFNLPLKSKILSINKFGYKSNTDKISGFLPIPKTKTFVKNSKCVEKNFIDATPKNKTLNNEKIFEPNDIISKLVFNPENANIFYKNSEKSDGLCIKSKVNCSNLKDDLQSQSNCLKTKDTIKKKFGFTSKIKPPEVSRRFSQNIEPTIKVTKQLRYSNVIKDKSPEIDTSKIKSNFSILNFPCVDNIESDDINHETLKKVDASIGIIDPSLDKTEMMAKYELDETFISGCDNTCNDEQLNEFTNRKDFAVSDVPLNESFESLNIMEKSNFNADFFFKTDHNDEPKIIDKFSNLNLKKNQSSIMQCDEIVNIEPKVDELICKIPSRKSDIMNDKRKSKSFTKKLFKVKSEIPKLNLIPSTIDKNFNKISKRKSFDSPESVNLNILSAGKEKDLDLNISNLKRSKNLFLSKLSLCSPRETKTSYSRLDISTDNAQMDILNVKIDQLTESKNKAVEKSTLLQKRVDELTDKIKSTSQKFDEYREEMQDYQELLELATLDKETAEEEIELKNETINNLDNELLALKEKIKKLTDSDISERSNKSINNNPSITEMMFLKEKIQSLKEVILKMRQLSINEKQEIENLTGQLSKSNIHLKKLVNVEAELKNKNKLIQKKVYNLLEQVDSASYAQDMVETLSEKILDQENTIEILLEERTNLESLYETNEELCENYKESIDELKLEICNLEKKNYEIKMQSLDYKNSMEQKEISCKEYRQNIKFLKDKIAKMEFEIEEKEDFTITNNNVSKKIDHIWKKIGRVLIKNVIRIEIESLENFEKLLKYIDPSCHEYIPLIQYFVQIERVEKLNKILINTLLKIELLGRGFCHDLYLSSFQITIAFLLHMKTQIEGIYLAVFTNRNYENEISYFYKSCSEIFRQLIEYELSEPINLEPLINYTIPSLNIPIPLHTFFSNFFQIMEIYIKLHESIQVDTKNIYNKLVKDFNGDFTKNKYITPESDMGNYVTDIDGKISIFITSILKNDAREGSLIDLLNFIYDFMMNLNNSSIETIKIDIYQYMSKICHKLKCDKTETITQELATDRVFEIKLTELKEQLSIEKIRNVTIDEKLKSTCKKHFIESEKLKKQVNIFKDKLDQKIDSSKNYQSDLKEQLENVTKINIDLKKKIENQIQDDYCNNHKLCTKNEIEEIREMCDSKLNELRYKLSSFYKEKNSNNVQSMIQTLNQFDYTIQPIQFKPINKNTHYLKKQLCKEMISYKLVNLSENKKENLGKYFKHIHQMNYLKYCATEINMSN